MSASSFDALLQIAPLARAVEAPSRGVREARTFGPTLEQAYASEQARESAAPAEVDDDPVEAAARGESDSFNAADERTDSADEAGETASLSEEAEDVRDADDDSAADHVEVSELASTAVVANEQQAAAVAGAALVTERDAADGGEPAETSVAETVPAKRKAGEGQAKAVRKPHDPLPGDGADAALKGEETTAEKRVKNAGETSTVDTPDKSASQTQAIEELAPNANRPLDDETEAGVEGKSDDSGRGELRIKKAEGVEPVKLPPVELTADLAAAVERQAALVDPSGTAESGSVEVAAAPPVDAANGGNNTTRAAAALDRLAATSPRRSDDAARADGEPTIDRPRFVQRVEGALRAAQQRDGRVQVRLAPPELGVVHIELAVQNGVMTAKLEAETAAARNALLDNLPALRERLAEQNIRVEKFDVDVRRDPQHGGRDHGMRDERGYHGESNSHGRRGRPATTALTVAASKAARTVNSASDAGLDVRI